MTWSVLILLFAIFEYAGSAAFDVNIVVVLFSVRNLLLLCEKANVVASTTTLLDYSIWEYPLFSIEVI